MYRDYDPITDANHDPPVKHPRIMPPVSNFSTALDILLNRTGTLSELHSMWPSTCFSVASRDLAQQLADYIAPPLRTISQSELTQLATLNNTIELLTPDKIQELFGLHDTYFAIKLLGDDHCCLITQSHIYSYVLGPLSYTCMAKCEHTMVYIQMIDYLGNGIVTDRFESYEVLRGSIRRIFAPYHNEEYRLRLPCGLLLKSGKNARLSNSETSYGFTNPGVFANLPLSCLVDDYGNVYRMQMGMVYISQYYGTFQTYDFSE